MEFPKSLGIWTADQIAECVDYENHLTEDEGRDLYVKLWGFLSEAKNPTPLGGDGSNGTVETPGETLSLDNDDKAGHWWHRLTEREQAAIAKELL